MLTNRGRLLQAKAQSGVPLKYTRIGLGDGELGTSQAGELNALKREVLNLPIKKLKLISNNIATIGTTLDNNNLTSGFYFRELGIFALDPDVGEILYCYANAGTLAEYIPAGGGSDIVEKIIDVQVITGNAANVSAVIDQSLVFETVDESNSKINAVRDIAESKYKKPAAGIPKSDLETPLQNSINEISKKVDKVTGKQLSTEDYTTAEKNKLSAIEAGAQKNAISSVNKKTGAVVLTAEDVGAETPQNAQAKATKAFEDAIAWATDLGLGAKAPKQVTDLDLAMETGWYTFVNTTLNTPRASSYGVVIVSSRNADRKTQQATILAGNTDVQTFQRSQGTSGWGDWVQMETTAGAQAKADAVKSKQVNLVADNINANALASTYQEGISVGRVHTAGLGYPSQWGVVTTIRSSAYATQEFATTTTADVPAQRWIRKNNPTSGAWGAWTEVGTADYSVNANSLGYNTDPNLTDIPYILTSHVNGPSGGGAQWHIRTYFYSARGGNRAQIGISYSSTPRFMVRNFYNNVWSAWSELESVAGAQAKVDAHADLRNNPHNVTSAQINLITPLAADAPTGSYPFGLSVFNVEPETAGYPKTYGLVMTIKQSSSRITQWFYMHGFTSTDVGAYFRQGHNAGWQPWQQVETTAGAQAKADAAANLIIAPRDSADPPQGYPNGISIFHLQAGVTPGYPLGLAIVETVKSGNNRIFQTIYTTATTSGGNKTFRRYQATSTSNTWSDWEEIDAVKSVAGKTGDVELAAADIKTGVMDVGRLPNATIAARGAVQLSTSYQSTSATMAATPSAVKQAYDLAQSALTQANDGKTTIAGAITAKGVSASPSDTFPTLANKIGHIETGIKSASGTGTLTSAAIVINNLGFKPRRVMVTTRSIANLVFNNKLLTNASVQGDRVVLNWVWDANGQVTRAGTNVPVAESGALTITAAGFTVPGGTLGTSGTYEWEAYE